MQLLRRFASASGALALLSLLLIVGIGPGREVRPAFACTGGPSHLEWHAGRAQFVALVDVVAVGGSENTLPRVTPEPSPVGFPPSTPAPSDFDLRGIEATLEVVVDFLGSAPSQFDIDDDRRAETEEHLRQQEARPWFIAPCPPGLLVPRYAEGERYLVVAGAYDEGASTVTMLRYPIENGSLVIGDSPDGISNILIVTAPTYDAFFAGVPYTSGGTNDEGIEFRHLTGAVPLAQFRAAVQTIFLGAPAPPSVAPTSSPELPSIEEMACNGTLAQAIGGDVIGVGNLSLALPGYTGFAYAPLVLDPGGEALRICHLETRAVITLSDASGAEIGRVTQEGLGDDVLDQLVAGVTVKARPSSISPPDTGDGGLR